jgi:hypothetical protein
MDEKSKGSLFFLQLPNDLARLLGSPEVIGTSCDSSEMHSPRIEFNEEEHIKSFQKDRLYCEEVTGQ